MLGMGKAKLSHLIVFGLFFVTVVTSKTSLMLIVFLSYNGTLARSGKTMYDVPTNFEITSSENGMIYEK